MLSAVFCFALLDATSKHLSQTFNVPLLVWARYSVHLLLMLILFGPSRRLRLIATARPIAQIARALLLVGVTGFAMAAFRVMPLAETTALLFITPLIVALLAGPMLGEHVGSRRWLAALAGFGGTLLIVRPSGDLPADGIVFAMTRLTESTPSVDPGVPPSAITNLLPTLMPTCGPATTFKFTNLFLPVFKESINGIFRYFNLILRSTSISLYF